MAKKTGLLILMTIVGLFCVVQLWRAGLTVVGYANPITPPQDLGFENNYLIEVTPTPIVEPVVSIAPEANPVSAVQIESGISTTISYDDGLLPDRIYISKVGLSLPVKYVPLVDGTWAVNEAAANYAEGSGYINSERSNIGLFGHDRDNAFHEIKQLAKGDVIELYADGVVARYRVTESFKTKPTSIEVFADTETPTLTLITCDSIFNNNRYIVKASLIDIITQ